MRSFISRRLTALYIVLPALVVIAIAVHKRREHINAGSTAEVRRGTINESVYGIGTITARRSFALKAAVTGNAKHVAVKEGDHVAKGDRLLDMDETVFRAPFSGTITSLPVKEGEAVFAQSVVLNLVDLEDRYVIVSLEQRGALRIRIGQSARLSFDSIRDETYDGTVEAVYSNDNNFLVRIGVTKLAPQLLPGMTADVAIKVAEHANALIVPASALQDGHVTLVSASDKRTSIDIKTGVIDEAMVEIKGGDLKEGDKVVTFEAKKP